MEVISETIQISNELGYFYYWVKNKKKNSWLTSKLYDNREDCLINAMTLDGIENGIIQSDLTPYKKEKYTAPKKVRFDETPYVNSGFLQVIPDSQSFDDIEQILQYVKTRSNDKYLEIALQNTINNGFKLTK